MEKIKFKYIENIELSLRAIFLLKIFFRLHNYTMYTSAPYDWMHRKYEIKYNIRDDEKSNDIAWYELRDNGLIQSVEVGEGCYFKYEISKKGKTFKRKISKINTDVYNHLIPKDFEMYLEN